MNEDLKHKILNINIDGVFQNIEEHTIYTNPESIQKLMQSYVDRFLERITDVERVQKIRERYAIKYDRSWAEKQVKYNFFNEYELDELMESCESEMFRKKFLYDTEISKGIFSSDDTVINNELTDTLATICESQHDWEMFLKEPHVLPESLEREDYIKKMGIFLGMVKYVQHLQSLLGGSLETVGVLKRFKLLQSLPIDSKNPPKNLYDAICRLTPNAMDKYDIFALLFGMSMAHVRRDKVAVNMDKEMYDNSNHAEFLYKHFSYVRRRDSTRKTKPK